MDEEKKEEDDEEEDFPILIAQAEQEEPKPVLKQDALVLGTEEDLEETNNTFQKFSKELKERINEMSARDKSEVCLLQDIGRGLQVELHSKQLNIIDLANVGIQTFDWLQNQRGLNNNKHYVG